VSGTASELMRQPPHSLPPSDPENGLRSPSGIPTISSASGLGSFAKRGILGSGG